MDFIGRFSTPNVKLAYYIDENELGYLFNEKRVFLSLNDIKLSMVNGFMFKSKMIGKFPLFSMNVVGLGVLSVYFLVTKTFLNNSLYLTNRLYNLKCLIGIGSESGNYMYGNSIFTLSSCHDDRYVYMEVPPEVGYVLSIVSPLDRYNFLMPILESMPFKVMTTEDISAGFIRGYDMSLSELIASR